MSIDMYEASVPVFVRMLGNLSAILDKGEAFAKAKNIDETVLVNARLAPDMYPLSRQVQIATDISKGCAARLAGLEIPSYEDNEKSFADLKARVAKTLAFVQSVKPEQIKGSDTKAISFKTRLNEYNYEGADYLRYFVLPNIYFHITTTYAILRHNGVEIGKMDFLGR